MIRPEAPNKLASSYDLIDHVFIIFFPCLHRHIFSLLTNTIYISVDGRKWNQISFLYKVVYRYNIYVQKSRGRVFTEAKHWNFFIIQSILRFFVLFETLALYSVEKLVTLCHSSQHHDKTIFMLRGRIDNFPVNFISMLLLWWESRAFKLEFLTFFMFAFTKGIATSGSKLTTIIWKQSERKSDSLWFKSFHITSASATL